MKSSKLSVVLCILLSMLVTSCNLTPELEPIPLEVNEENLGDEDPNIEYVYGPIVKVKKEFDNQVINSKSSVSFTNAWRDLTRNDLQKLSRNSSIYFLSHDAMRNRFRDLMNKGSRRPANVCVNSVQVGSSGRNPNRDYNWYAQVRGKGIQKSKTTSNFTSWKKVRGTNRRSERNRSNKGRWMELPGEWRVTTSEEKNWNVTGSISTEVGGKVGVPLVTEGSVKVTVSLSAGGGGSKSYSVTEVIRGGRIWVPAGKVANWEASERHKTVAVEWHVPLQFKGRVGADYGQNKLDGHHYWSLPANKFFFDFANGKKKYVIKVKEETNKEIRVRAWVSNN